MDGIAIHIFILAYIYGRMCTVPKLERDDPVAHPGLGGAIENHRAQRRQRMKAWFGPAHPLMFLPLRSD